MDDDPAPDVETPPAEPFKAARPATGGLATTIVAVAACAVVLLIYYQLRAPVEAPKDEYQPIDIKALAEGYASGQGRNGESVFRDAGLIITSPPGVKVRGASQQTLTQIAAELDGRTLIEFLVGPIYPWMTVPELKRNLSGTWHEGGDVRLGEFNVSTPATHWLEMPSSILLVTSTRLVFITFRASASADARVIDVAQAQPETVELINGLTFLTPPKAGVRNRAHFRLTPEQASAPASDELRATLDADLKVIEAITRPLPLPLSLGVRAYKERGMNTLDALTLHELLKPAVAAARGATPGHGR